MGKAALERYRAQRAAAEAAPKPYNRRPVGPLPPRHQRHIRDDYVITRIVAALIHGVPVPTIARDLRIPKAAVWVVALRERQI